MGVKLGCLALREPRGREQIDDVGEQSAEENICT
jgi:hypothetical protein